MKVNLLQVYYKSQCVLDATVNCYYLIPKQEQLLRWFKTL